MPHPNAPLFSLEANPSAILDDIISEFESGHYSEGKFLSIFRQACLVNLWLFLKHVAGYAGPFDQLNVGLHREMCEFAQTTHTPGSRNAAFFGRGCFKSTIFTMGDNAWSILRNPDITSAIFSCTSDRSEEFMHTIQRIFDANELFKILFSEFVPEKSSRRWNDVEAVLPNRTRYNTSPTVKGYGVCCNTAGIHVDRIYVDDPVGDQQLNANLQSSADMYKISNWLKSNLRALTKGPTTSVMHVGTRYAVDDAHGFIFESIKEKFGYWKELDERTYKIMPNGEWRVYYRMVKENGIITFPERYTEEELEKIRTENPWYYATQIQNHPQASGLSELNQYSIGEVELVWQDRWCIRFFNNGTATLHELSACCVVQAVDPAGTEKYISAKTSRTAVVVLCRTASDLFVALSVTAGYFSPMEMFDILFSNAKKFVDYIGKTLLEAQGAFKILGPLLKEENRRRNEAAKDRPIRLNVVPITKTGEKDAVIRNTLQPILEKQQLYADKAARSLILDELNVFPQSRHKDVLDALCLAINNTYKPLTEKERDDREAVDTEWANLPCTAAGIW